MFDPQDFQDSPEEIGADLFLAACAPFLVQFRRGAGPEAAARMYRGLLLAAYSAMCADLGQQQALDLLGSMRHALERLDPRGRLQ